MVTTIEIQPGKGLSDLMFGSSIAEAESIFGKPEESQLLDDIGDSPSTVWHYWDEGVSLFFDERDHQTFCCAEVDNTGTLLWGEELFKLKEKQIIELFKSKGFDQFESEQHEWGEKRISFDFINVDLYFEKNKLTSVNYGKLTQHSPILILPN